MASPISRVRIQSCSLTRYIQRRPWPSVKDDDNILDAHLFRVEVVLVDLAEISQFLQEEKAPKGYSEEKNKILAIKASLFTLINESLYKLGLDDVLRRCVLEHERYDIIEEAHSRAVGGHFQVDTTIKKILHLGLWWPSINKDCTNQNM